MHIEDFQHEGRPPERLRVRFTDTLRGGEDGEWKSLLGHRDIQHFGEDGRYLPVYVGDQ